MEIDRLRAADAHAWLSRAADDVFAAEHDLSAGNRLYADVAFHCQQAVEKAFKAFLTWHDQPFRRTHNLEELGRQIASLDPSIGAVVDRAVVLSEYAWAYRYPGGPPPLTAEEIGEAMRIARITLKSITERLPSEASPPDAG